ncbi:VC0807 family protein [Nocardioides sp. MAHUQ-72]|uniref:VC0807 family protein n=1 Tax=unclassified Nocardioides TaxID=2615069 RepID=UPI003608C15A
MTPAGTLVLDRAADLDVDTSPEPAAPPSMRSIMGRLAASLLVAVVVPGVVFYLALVLYGITAALLAALAWTYGAIVWRWATRRPMSGMLALTVTIMTGKTIFTLMTGNTFVYFAQPVATDALVGAAFLLSLATARPVVARLAADFYPLTHEVASRPAIRKLFWHLTLLWAFVVLLKGVATLWLLMTQSMVDFVLLKNAAMAGLTVLGVAVTVAAAAAVARKEGLLGGSRVPVPVA